MSHRTDWKGAVVVALSLAILGLAACGSSGPSVSHLSKRAFVSDDIDGSLHIENAATDVESGFTITTGAQPGTMVLSPDKSITLVFDAGQNSLSVVSNSTEASLGTIVLPNVSTSYASMSDNIVGFVAVPNCPPASCSGFSNVVGVVDLATTFNVTGTVFQALNTTTQLYVPLNVATTLVLSPAESTLLLFGGPADHQDAFTVIDTTLAKTTPATAGTLMASAAFDKPVSAVFSTDGSKAYILNCGAECGGTAASVTVLNMLTTPPTASAPIPVAGATTGLLNGTTLYVAGSPPGAGCGTASLHATSCGTLQTIDTGTLTASAPVVITDGFHNHMELGSNGQLFIGAHTCTNITTATETRGCLTIFDTTKSAVAVPCLTVPTVQFCLNQVNFDVTGIAPIGGRNIVYVVQGGELEIYDTTTDALTPTQIDVVGKAVDVKYVDK